MKLREARADKFLTMRELAARAGVALGTIRDVENGKAIPRLTTARKIAAALEVEPASIDEFLAAADRTKQTQ